jgi:tRNA A37 threonylcarbamoyladenosine synthetase subunit TsaC/SUA5/YrdC
VPIKTGTSCLKRLSLKDIILYQVKPTINDTKKKIKSALQRCSISLNQNEIVAIPTETVYGLAGNAYSEKALKDF